MEPSFHGLKALRAQRQWSLDKASQKTGVSKAMLGQIERGESSPTLNTLWKIAQGFELSFSQLMANLMPDQGIGDSQPFAPHASGLAVKALIPYDPQMKAELLELTLSPGCLRESAPHEAGVREHIILLQGKLSIQANGQWQALAAGQVFEFMADQPHAYRNDDAEAAALFHNLIFYPQGRIS